MPDSCNLDVTFRAIARHPSSTRRLETRLPRGRRLTDVSILILFSHMTKRQEDGLDLTHDIFFFERSIANQP